MGYKVAIDMCYFGRIHFGGKDEVAYNLLNGFEKIGVSDKIVCFAYRGMSAKISSISPNIRICVVPKIKGHRFFDAILVWIRSFYEERWAIKNNVPLLLLPNKPTVNRRLKIKTAEIPHDISIFEDIHSSDNTRRQIKRQKIAITNDFRNRDYIVAISDYDKEEMIKFFPLAKERIVRIYDPIRFGSTVSNGEKKYILALALFSFLLNSCQKDETQPALSKTKKNTLAKTITATMEGVGTKATEDNGSFADSLPRKHR